jgi:hypothetical protein
MAHIIVDIYSWEFSCILIIYTKYTHAMHFYKKDMHACRMSTSWAKCVHGAGGFAYETNFLLMARKRRMAVAACIF